MTMHTIEPTRATLHGTFSREHAPVLQIESGDTVRYRTLEAGWGIAPPPADPTQRARFAERDPVRDRGHALCGPTAVRGAQPGMTLEVRIGAMRSGGWGWTDAGGWDSALNRRLGVAEGAGTSLWWTLDDDAGIATDQHGHRVKMRPFMGVLGMPPDEPGLHPTAPPRVWGGNIDCKELITGTTLYLPISVPGALFSVGDGHAAQGDGEVSTTAIECPMDQVDLTFVLRDDLRLTTPRADTPVGQLTFGFHEDLTEAMFSALRAMLELIQAQHGVDYTTALALSSVAVDLRITQICNGVSGAHALLPHGAIEV
jgi:acetamidase/formamidase